MHNMLCCNMLAFKAWLLTNDWQSMIKNIEKDYLDPFKSLKLCDWAAQEVKDNITTAIKLQKDTWLTDRECTWVLDNITTFKQQPKWDVEWQKKIKKAVLVQHDIIRENMLIILSLSLLYLNFVDICQGDYSAHVKQCIWCFAVVFQGSNSKNYAGKTLHMVACLKKIWNADFKWVDMKPANGTWLMISTQMHVVWLLLDQSVWSRK